MSPGRHHHIQPPFEDPRSLERIAGLQGIEELLIERDTSQGLRSRRRLAYCNMLACEAGNGCIEQLLRAPLLAAI